MSGRDRSGARQGSSAPPAGDVVFHTPWIGSILTDGALPPGGAETQILMLASELARQGVRTAIIAFGRRPELPAEAHGITIVPRRPRKKRRSMLGKVLQELMVWPALRRAPGRTIVQRGAGLELGLIALFARLTRRRLVFSTANVSDFDYELMTTRRPILWTYRIGVRLADEIVVQTSEQAKLCQARFGRRATVIRSIEPLADKPAVEPEAFLWVGRLVSYKRPLDYVELARAVPEARFWMLGVPFAHHEDSREVAEEVVRRAAKVPNLTLLAPRSRAEVQTLMAKAVSSVNTADFEGMPNVLLEAWSLGVPALVLNHDPDGVVTEHDLGGFAHGSMDEFVRLASEQWMSRGDRAALSERCRTYIASHHAPQRVVAQWMNVIGVAEARSAPEPLMEPEATCAA